MHTMHACYNVGALTQCSPNKASCSLTVRLMLMCMLYVHRVEKMNATPGTRRQHANRTDTVVLCASHATYGCAPCRPNPVHFELATWSLQTRLDHHAGV